MPKAIRSWDDMKAFGVYYTTGEADPLKLRILLDLSENGEKLVKLLLGLPDDAKLYKNNNSGHGMPDGPAVASISLPFAVFRDLAAVALICAGARQVIISPDGVVGLMDDRDEELVSAYIERYGPEKLRFVKG